MSRKSWVGGWSSTPPHFPWGWYVSCSLAQVWVHRQMDAVQKYRAPHQVHNPRQLPVHRLLHRLLSNLPHTLVHELLQRLAHSRSPIFRIQSIREAGGGWVGRF